jgi:hypothetical protein
MAGNGPAPKLNRQRRGTPTRGDWVKLEPLKGPVLQELDELPSPMLPPRWDKDAHAYTEPQEFDWPFTTRQLWDAWRASPVTALWSDDDLAFAIDTIMLHAEATLGGRGATPGELRLRQESLGLTPKGRRDNRYLLPDEAPDAPAEEKPAADTKLRVLPEAI